MAAVAAGAGLGAAFTGAEIGAAGLGAVSGRLWAAVAAAALRAVAGAGLGVSLVRVHWFSAASRGEAGQHEEPPGGDARKRRGYSEG